MRLPSFGIPRHLVPAFWAMLFIEGSLGAYLGVWPLWMERLGADVTIIGLLLGVGGFLRILVVAPSATLSDRIGPRRLLLIARAVALVAYLGAFVATDWKQLLPVILLMSMAEITFPVIQSYVAHHSNEEDRVRSFTIVFNVGPSFALALSPLLTGAVVALFDVRAAFALTALFCVGSVVAVVQFDRDEKHEATTSAPVSSYRQALSQRKVQILLALQGAMIFFLAIGIALIPTFLEDVRGISPAIISILSAFPAVGSAVFGLVASRNRTVQDNPIIGIVFGTGITILGLMIFRQFDQPPILALAFFFRGGFFSNWIMFISAIGSASNPIHRSRSFASSEIVGGVCYAMGPMVAGVLYAVRPELPFEVSIVLGLLLIPVMFIASRRLQAMPAVEAAMPA